MLRGMTIRVRRTASRGLLRWAFRLDRTPFPAMSSPAPRQASRVPMVPRVPLIPLIGDR